MNRGARALGAIVAAVSGFALAASIVPATAPAAQSAAGAAWADGVWISRAEVRRLPQRGSAWQALLARANQNMGRADLSDQESEHDTNVLAIALVYARTGQERYRRKAAAGVMGAIGTERGGRTLALGRGLVAYVVAADLIDLDGLNPAQGKVFRRWLREVRDERLEPEGRPTLILTHEGEANNWGTHAGASRIGTAIYLRDRADLARAAAVFKGWLGDRDTYHGFTFPKNQSWQEDESEPVGVVAAGAEKKGQPIGGALPDDMRRGCGIRFPPCPTGYPWEAMQGAVVQAELLSRQGYSAWRWQDEGVRRAAAFLVDLDRRYPGDDWGAQDDDTWIPWLLNARYGMRLRTQSPARPGKGMGWTDWTHGPGRCRGGACLASLQEGRAVAPVKSRRRIRSADDAGTLPIAGTVGAIGVIAAAIVAIRVRRRTPTRRRPDASRV